MKEDIRAITIKGNLYWMPKAEANKLIEFLVKLEGGDKLAKNTEQKWANITYLKNWFWREIREYKGRLKK